MPCKIKRQALDNETKLVKDEVRERKSVSPSIRHTSLWKAVIMQAFLDIKNNSNRSEDKLAKIQARSWLTSGSKDFKSVCAMAEYNYEYVENKAKAIVFENSSIKEDKHNIYYENKCLIMSS